MVVLALVHIHLPLLIQRQALGISKLKILRLTVKIVLVIDPFSLKHVLCKD